MTVPTNTLIAMARSDATHLDREPQKWWDDEHVLDNGHAAVRLRQLADRLEELTT